MNWIQINKPEQIDEITNQSQQRPVIIFKHSTRCSISRASLDRLERNWNNSEMQEVTPYFLDLLSFREISNKIAEKFGIEHQSPQVIVLSKGAPVLDLSHFDIDYQRIREQVKN